MPIRECEFEKYSDSHWRCIHCGKGIHERLLRMHHPCRHDRDMLAVRYLDGFTCLYRGVLTRTDKCQLCGQRDVDAPVHSCTIFGECTIHAYGLRTENGDKMPLCITCERRESVQIVDITAKV